MSYVVNVGHDAETGRYYVLSSDIPGLNVEATSIEELIAVARDVAPDLLIDRTSGSSISFRHDLEFV